MGLSLGGCMALRLAEVHGDGVRGLVIVNPSIANDVPLLRLAPLLKFVLSSVPGVANDIKKEGVTELAYDRTPVRAAATLPTLWALVQSELATLTLPVLVYHSPDDHVVKPTSVRILRETLGDNLTVRDCADSYHVATLDNDAPAIYQGSLDFIRTHASVPLH
jgi:carboxylesterase